MFRSTTGYTALAAALAAFLVADSADALVECKPRNDEIIYAVDCDDSSSTTGGIAEAIEECGTGTYAGQCTVQLPQGIVSVSSVIAIGSLTTSADFRSGITLRGHGAGHIANSPSTSPRCGTTLEWSGGSSAIAMIDLMGTRGVSVVDLCVDGSELLENGISIRADNETGSLAQSNRLARVHVVDTTETGFLISGEGTTKSDQIDHTLFDNVRVYVGRNSGVKTAPDYCIKQDGGSPATLNVVEGLDCPLYGVDGVVNSGGGIAIRDSFFGDRLDDASSAGAAIRVTGNANVVSIESNEFEIDHGSAIVTEFGTSAGSPTMTIANNSIAIDDDADALDFNHKGTLVLMGNRVVERDTWSSGGPGWRITPGSATLWLTEGENLFASGVVFEREDDDIRSSKGAGVQVNACGSIVGAARGHLCWQTGTSGSGEGLYVCDATDGECSSSAEWKHFGAGS